MQSLALNLAQYDPADVVSRNFAATYRYVWIRLDLGSRCSAYSIAHSSQVFGEYSYSQYDPLLIAHLLSQMSADNVCRSHAYC